MTKKTLTMMAVGDVILEQPDAELLLTLAAPVLRTGDVVVGHGEVPLKGVSTFTSDANSPGALPNNLRAFPSAGFNVVTMGCNHIWDQGVPGIEDTITGLRKYGIATVGSGMNIDEARKPAVIEREGTRFGFLSYNCAGPKGSWASMVKPGCAYVSIITHYEKTERTGDFTSEVYTWAEPRSLEAMADDIKKVRPLCDVLVVSLHKGIMLVRAKLAMYEKEVSHAAIDAGADLVLGHHPSILRGIELYKGKPIFHGLGNFVFGIGPISEKEAKARKLAGLPPHPSRSQTYSSEALKTINAERRQTIIAKCTIEGRKISRVGYLPCLRNEQEQQEILKNDGRGKQVFDYMDQITREAGLNARYEWEGDEVVVHESTH